MTSPMADKRMIQIDFGGFAKRFMNTIQPAERVISNQHILYDAAAITKISIDWFDSQYWQQQNKLLGSAPGRGTSHFFRHEQTDYVLRHYHRGGMVARLLQDRYLYTGLQASRAWREWYLLMQMHAQGLPVPAPAAARVIRQGAFYRADLITVKVTAATSLAQCLTEAGLSDSVWRAMGQTVRRFHDAGIYHADLNAHNILLCAENEAPKVYVIDFDRGQQQQSPIARFAPNLARLQRSLNKLKRLTPGLCFEPANWQQFMAAYAGKPCDNSYDNRPDKGRE